MAAFMETKTLCGHQPNDADCTYCLDIYECGLMQKEAEKKETAGGK